MPKTQSMSEHRAPSSEIICERRIFLFCFYATTTIASDKFFTIKCCWRCRRRHSTTIVVVILACVWLLVFSSEMCYGRCAWWNKIVRIINIQIPAILSSPLVYTAKDYLSQNLLLLLPMLHTTYTALGWSCLCKSHWVEMTKLFVHIICECCTFHFVL